MGQAMVGRGPPYAGGDAVCCRAGTGPWTPANQRLQCPGADV